MRRYLLIAIFALSSLLPHAGGNFGPLNVRRACGAKGDINTDDSVAIQKCITQGKAQARPVYLPTGMYRVTQSLDATYSENTGGGLNIDGDGINRGSNGIGGTTILDELTSPGAVIDFGGCTQCRISNLTIKRIDGIPSQSSFGILHSTGPTGNVAAGYGFVVRDVNVYECFSCAAIAIVGPDKPMLENVDTQGSVIVGYDLGLSKGVSQFYDLGKLLPAGNLTMAYLTNVNANTDTVPALQLTGGQYYVLVNSGGAMVGSGAAGVAIRVTGQGPNGAVAEDVINATGLRTENQTYAYNSGQCVAGAVTVPQGCGMTAIAFVGRSIGGRISGNLCVDPQGAVIAMESRVLIENYQEISDYCGDGPFFRIAAGSLIRDDEFRMGDGVPSMGVIDPGSTWSDVTIHYPGSTAFTVQQAGAMFPTGSQGTVIDGSARVPLGK